MSITSTDRAACDAFFSSRHMNVTCTGGGGCAGDPSVAASIYGACTKY